MKTGFPSLARFGALSFFVVVITACAATSPLPSVEKGISGGPSISEKQINRQEEISRQQRELMRF